MPATVIYTYDPEFKKGYEKLILMYPKVKFLEQGDLKQQIIENLGEYTMFEVDDDIMLEHFDENCPEFTEFKENPEILCLSLRMSPSYRGYPGTNKWAWRGLKHSWGYPMSITATIFRKEDILPIIEKATIDLPHEMEIALRSNPPERPFMLCFDKPRLITNEANIVQNRYPTANFGVDLHELEKRFLDGEQLSIDYIKKVAETARDCFIRVNFEWERKNNWLLDYRKRVVSQSGEDGILEKVFEILGIDVGWLVDVGACRIRHSNTYNLVKNKGWSGVMLEKDKIAVKRLKMTYRNFNIRCIYGTVEAEGRKSLNELLKKSTIPKKFEFLSIDIDGNDYYIWKTLTDYEPLVVGIEFNPVLKLGTYVQPYDGKGGSSLSSIVELGKTLGYELISCTPANAFFVKKDLFYKFNIKDNSPSELIVEGDYAYGKDKTKYENTNINS
jgi:hypothetical protein